MICHCLAVVVFFNRYIAGIILRVVRHKNWDETRDDYEPTVTTIIPMFNEGVAIKETLESILASNYPAEKLNVWLLERCRSLWQELRHPEYADLTVAEMLEHEQPSLMPMVAPFDGYVETLGKVSSTCLVTLDRNRYSVPCELVGQVVSLRLYPERIDMVAHDLRMASHPRSFTRQQTLYDWQHYIPLIERKPGALRNGAPFADMPEALQRLRSLLLRREGGDRVMAKVLSAIAQFGLESVLVAVDLVLESGLPSAEHVENMLNRLKSGPMPPPVETPLTISEAPIADTGRYDQLRVEVSDHA